MGSASLPHQLSQFCGSQQNHLLALQQNFSHLLPPNYLEAATQPFGLHENLTNHLRNHHNRSYNHNQTHHNHHHNHRHNHNQFAPNMAGAPSSNLGASNFLTSSVNPIHSIIGTSNGNSNAYKSSLTSSSREYSPSHLARSHNNWRKSRSQTYSKHANVTPNGSPHSLLDLSAKVVAEHIPFQSIEQRYEHVPEPAQRRIIFWSFPRHEDDIKMYSSLSSDTFNANGPTTATSSSAPNSTNNTNSTTSNNNNSVNPQPMSSNGTFAAWVEQSASTSSSSSVLPSGAALAKGNNLQKQLTFHKGLRLYNEGCVHEVLQVGFNLSGLVVVKSNSTLQTNNKLRANSSSNNISNNNNNFHHNNQAFNAQNDALNQVAVTSNSDSMNNSSTSDSSTKSYRVSVTFDRCKITSVSCSCELQDIFWCEHVAALILYRIRNPETIDLRVPISETLLSLDRQQLQKLVQYIIAEHHTEVLPTAQRLLDEMRQSFSEINQIHGAPDPTAGACADDAHIWHLDEHQVNEKVQSYLTILCSNSKDVSVIKHMNALFEKIREMFRAKDSNGTRLLKLITEQFLQVATRSDKSRPLWDQLVSLWVVVMLNPDLTKLDRKNFIRLLTNWSKVTKCPKEDVERRVAVKRKAAELSDDEDSDECSNSFYSEYPMSYNQSNNIPAHMATHRHRTFQHNNGFPVLRPFNQLPPLLPPTCPCQLPQSIAKKMRTHHFVQHNAESHGGSLPLASSSRGAPASRPSGPSKSNENRSVPLANQEPRSVFYRALDFQDISWDDPHLQLILNKDGPVDHETSKSYLLDFSGNPLWNEPVSQAAARVETLRSHGYREQALRLTVATVRRLKLHQDQWCMTSSPDSSDSQSYFRNQEIDQEGWVGHPFDPINVMVDLLLESSLTEVANSGPNMASNFCNLGNSRCSCPYNQALADFTHRLLPDFASLSYQNRIEGFPVPPLVNLAPRRPSNATHQSSTDKTPFFHVPVPGCCQKDSYLALAVEVALMALGQQRSIPTNATAHDRAVRQESELISKLESIDTSDPLLMDIMKHQTNTLLEGGPFQNSCCGVPTDSAPLHTFARYLFEALVSHYPQLAYKVGVYALKMPLLTEENGENLGAARVSPRSGILNHLQAEQLLLAQTMLSKAKDEGQPGGFMRRVYRASVKNIRNPANLLKLSRHALKEAKPNGSALYRSLLETAFDLGLQVLKVTREPHTSNGKTRRDAIAFIVECATDLGLKSVLHVMKYSREHFSPIEALNLVVGRENDHVNLRSQALTKLKLKEHPLEEIELNCRSRDLVLECASLDPTNCALDALKFCETDDDSLKRALKIVMDAGSNGTMDSTQLIKVADHIHEREMTDKAFDIAMVAVDSLSIPSNSDNSSSKKDIFSACEYAQKVNGFSTLIPKLIDNIECATVLSEIYHRFNPGNLLSSNYRNYGPDLIASYRGNINFNEGYTDKLTGMYMQKLEDARWWDALLKRTIKAFVDTTRTRLQNISPRHYGEFIDFLVKAQATFEKATDGLQQFKDLISEIMKSYRTKKKLMERLKARFEYAIKAGL